MASALLAMSPPFVLSQVDDFTHESDHLEDEEIQVLETVHVHGFRLNKDQQLGPVPKYTPWPTMPPALQGQEVDDWMKARILVSKMAETTLVVLVPARKSSPQPGWSSRSHTMDVRSPNEWRRSRRWRIDGQNSLQNAREIAPGRFEETERIRTICTAPNGACQHVRSGSI